MNLNNLSNSQSFSHIININEERDKNSKDYPASPPQLKISISRSSSSSQVKEPTPLTQIAYETLSFNDIDEEIAPVKEKKNKKKNKSKKKSKTDDKGIKQNNLEFKNEFYDNFNSSEQRCQSPTKLNQDTFNLELTELNGKNLSIDDMIDTVETPNSSFQSFSNFKSSNSSLNPTSTTKSKHHKSNTSKTKINATSKSSSKLVQSSKQKKNKNKLTSKLMKQKTASLTNQFDDYVNEVKGLTSEEALK